MGLLIAEILSHLFRHRARTLLTLSGLSVGILALTLLGSLGEAVNVSLDQQEAAALSMFEVRPSTWERHLTPAVRRAIRHVPGVAGTLTSLWADLIPPEEKQETGFAFTVEALMAVDSDIPGLERSLAPHDASLHRGRWPARGATNEVLLDFDLASVRGWDVGDTVGIRGRPFVVTGILERPRLGSNARYAYVDYEALRNLLHLPADNLQTLYVIPEPGQDAAALAARIEDAVPGTHVQTPEQRMNETRRDQGLLAAIVAASGGLALLAGTLIVINTMLMSVRERRHEIGLKKALGAGAGDIVREFLLEASTLGLLGGGLGVLLAWCLILGVNQFTHEAWGLKLLTLTPRLGLGSVAFTTLLGALSGVYPAWRAALEDPVRALHDAPGVPYAETGLKRLIYLAGRRARWLLTGGGISAGILILTLALSLAEVLNGYTNAAVVATQDRVWLYPARQSVVNHATAVRHLERMEGVRGVVITASGGRLFDDRESLPGLFGTPSYLQGLDAPEPEFGFSVPYEARIERGRFLAPDSLHEVVLGPDLAEGLGLDVGDVLTVRDRDLLVVGIWAESHTQLPTDYEAHAFVTMAALRALEPELGPYLELTALVAPGAKAQEVAARIEEAMPEWQTETAEVAARDLRQATLLFSLILVLYVSLGLLVGGLSVMNTMVMAVMERSREIGLKKAVGASDRDVLAEIVEEAGWFGLMGGALGLVAAWLVAMGVNAFTRHAMDVRLLLVTPRLAIAVLVFTAFLGMIAGLYPAWRASRLDPIQALRSE
jgi:putative ABC transport system permease protein